MQIVKLNSINETYANITIKSINELIPEEDKELMNGVQETETNEGTNEPIEQERTDFSKYYIYGIIVVIVILGLVLIMNSRKKKQKNAVQPGPQVHYVQNVQPNSQPQPKQPVQTVTPVQQVPPIQSKTTEKTESPVKTQSNFCSNCGAAIQSGVKFCSECGNKI